MSREVIINLSAFRYVADYGVVVFLAQVGQQVVKTTAKKRWSGVAGETGRE